MKKILQQILYDMRHQPVIAAVTVCGTALAIFLIMVVVMMQQARLVPFAPESNRDRMMYTTYIWVKDSEGYGRSGPMTYAEARELYSELSTPECVSLYVKDIDVMNAGITGRPSVNVDVRHTDGNFWKVMDFAFIDGSPFTQEEYESGIPVAVVTEHTAREIFGTADVVGKEIYINKKPYRVKGVVKNVSPIASYAYAQAWIPIVIDEVRDSEWGSVAAMMLARDKSDFDAIHKEADQRLATYNSKINAMGDTATVFDAPYFHEAAIANYWSNSPSLYKEERKQRIGIYALLLLIPAINLSSMTQSRLRRRMSEIGVRRAFGCSRWNVVRSIVTENFLVTLAGALIGLILSMIFVVMFMDLIYDPGKWKSYSIPVTMDLAVLFDWGTFAWALVFCFLLNLLSSGIPALRASRVNPVTAINGNLKK